MPKGRYDPTFFDQLALVEDHHFWFRGRNRLILDISQRIRRELQPGSRILEIGCGTGNVLRSLEQAYSGGLVFGMDLWQEGLRYARQRTGCPLVRADLHHQPFGKPFHVIGMFDVLEHIEDDCGALEQVNSMLLRGGTLVITVPAHEALWSYFDEAAQHCRRYSLAGLSDRLKTAGFTVEFATEFMACTLPLLWVNRRVAALRNKRRSAEDTRRLAESEFRVVPGVNVLLSWTAEMEAWWVSRGYYLPFGSSIIAVAKAE